MKTLVMDEASGQFTLPEDKQAGRRMAGLQDWAPAQT